MASLFIILALVTHFVPGFTFILEDGNRTIKWPTEYHFRGELMNVLSGVVEPFEIWYSAKYNKSRKDYYGGTVKEYFVRQNGSKLVKHYKIFPFTSEEETNEVLCVEGTKEKHSGFLPTIKNYEIEGHKNYNGKVVDIWKYLKTEEYEKKLEKTLYVYQNDVGDSIPVYLEITKHNLWTGTVTTHTIKHYYGYDEPDAEMLNPESEEACEEHEIDRPNQRGKSPKHTSSDIGSIMKSYISHHKKKYEGDEHKMRKKILRKNWRRVVRHNKKNLSYKMTLNKFSDRTEEELAYLRGAIPSMKRVGTVPFPHTEEEVEQLVQELPESYDMRLDGYISSVKNQDSCGSCWAFSTVAAVEGALARSNGGRNVDLSEQSMVDCAWGFGNMGCNGGMLDRAYKYVLKHGIPTQMEYGLYLAKEGWCQIDNMTETFTIKAFATVPPLSVNAMKVALYKYGPVSVTINANKAVMAYHSGIFYDPTCNEEKLNHAVTVVGYGVNDGVTYWIVKNSWGEDWGEDGYILFSAVNNNCHILEDAFYPIV